MNTAYISICFLAVSGISIFYWNVFHIVAVRAARYRLFARRDELRSLAISGEIDADSHEYKKAESIICKAIGVIPSVSLFTFYFIARKHDANDKEADGFFDNLNPKVKNILIASVKDAFRIMAFNSPIIMALMSLIFFGVWAFGMTNILGFYAKVGEAIEKISTPKIKAAYI